MSVSSPIKKDILRSAAQWYALLQSEDVSEQQRREHQHWLQSSPEHRNAWQQVERLRQQLLSVPGKTSINTLRIKQQHGKHRRTVLRSFALLATGGAIGVLGKQHIPMERWLAHYKTAKGEHREFQLTDGTRVVMNTATALNLLDTASGRALHLYDGEIYVKTGASKNPLKPLEIHTEQGRITPLGTEFTVRVFASYTEVVVLQDAVDMKPSGRQDISQRLEAGNRARMTKDHIQVSTAPAHQSTWVKGLLVAIDWPLQQLINEISRYRTGILRLDSDIAHLQISGTFPIHDTNRALQAIANALPVTITKLTDYWVSITPEKK